MAVLDRSFPEILQSIINDVREIVRSEVRLAKSEIREEAVPASPSAILTGVGAATGLFAVLFLLIAIVCGLSVIVPAWAAALIVGAVLTALADAILGTSVRRWRTLYPVSDLQQKENLGQWNKQRIK